MTRIEAACRLDRLPGRCLALALLIAVAAPGPRPIAALHDAASRLDAAPEPVSLRTAPALPAWLAPKLSIGRVCRPPLVTAGRSDADAGPVLFRASLALDQISELHVRPD